MRNTDQSKPLIRAMTEAERAATSDWMRRLQSSLLRAIAKDAARMDARSRRVASRPIRTCQCGMKFQSQPPWAATMSVVESDPASMMTGTKASSSGNS